MCDRCQHVGRRGPSKGGHVVFLTRSFTHKRWCFVELRMFVWPPHSSRHSHNCECSRRRAVLLSRGQRCKRRHTGWNGDTLLVCIHLHIANHMHMCGRKWSHMVVLLQSRRHECTRSRSDTWPLVFWQQQVWEAPLGKGCQLMTLGGVTF